MSFANPTPLRVGMTGTLAGKRYRIAGRIVMGMEEAGETYYWNEFNLVNDEGESATLVYEETERAGQWRLFTLFEPEYPMTAPDAATRRVGDKLNLEGTDVRVTLVDESRVYHIEGTAPEGVELGDVAHYFNAEAGNAMQVVSWTGDEVEYYRGINLSRGIVASAFNLPQDRIAGFSDALSARLSREPTHDAWGGEHYDSMRSFVGKAVLIVLVAATAFAGYSFLRSKRQVTTRKTPAPASPLAVGNSGTLEDRKYHIRSHLVVEIAAVGHAFDRHEYRLADETGAEAVLIQEWQPGRHDWVLFTPLEPINPITPTQAAAIRVGETVNVDGHVAPVKELFQFTTIQADRNELPDTKRGSMSFGFVAQTASWPLLARWNETGITFYSGKLLAAKTVTDAFSKTGRE